MLEPIPYRDLTRRRLQAISASSPMVIDTDPISKKLLAKHDSD